MKGRIENRIKQNLLIICMIFMFIFAASSQIVFAHPGRTDSSGCHTCRTNCPSWGLSYGEYHCHRAKALPQPKSPIKSKFGEGGTGYTQPAPEYTSPSVSTIQNTDDSRTTVSQSVGTQSKKGFWQWLFSLFE